VNIFPGWRQAGRAMRWARTQPGVEHERSTDDVYHHVLHTWFDGPTEIDIAAAGETSYGGQHVSSLGIGRHGFVNASIEGADAWQILGILAAVGLIPGWLLAPDHDCGHHQMAHAASLN
jgi:hypothetical protein